MTVATEAFNKWLDEYELFWGREPSLEAQRAFAEGWMKGYLDRANIEPPVSVITGLFHGLSEEQKKAALEYRGDDSILPGHYVDSDGEEHPDAMIAKFARPGSQLDGMTVIAWPSPDAQYNWRFEATINGDEHHLWSFNESHFEFIRKANSNDVR